MNNKYYIRLSLFLLAFALSCVSTFSYAGSVDELKHEISFLAKKLLDESGKDTITVKQAAIKKPFIGVCPKPGSSGIKLACITPGHNAAKAGLETGDLVIAIDDLSMLENASHDGGHDSAYHQVFDKLKTGETLSFKVVRGEKEMIIKVKVGSISHPAYTMTISKDRIDD